MQPKLNTRTWVNNSILSYFYLRVEACKVLFKLIFSTWDSLKLFYFLTFWQKFRFRPKILSFAKTSLAENGWDYSLIDKNKPAIFLFFIFSFNWTYFHIVNHGVYKFIAKKLSNESGNLNAKLVINSHPSNYNPLYQNLFIQRNHVTVVIIVLYFVHLFP